jgi:hypothetical protein
MNWSVILADKAILDGARTLSRSWCDHSLQAKMTAGPSMILDTQHGVRTYCVVSYLKQAA